MHEWATWREGERAKCEIRKIISCLIGPKKSVTTLRGQIPKANKLALEAQTIFALQK